MGYSINKMIVEIKSEEYHGWLAKNLNSLVARNRQQRKKILLFMEWISREKVFIVFTDDMGKPLSMQKLLLLPPAIAKMIVFTGAKNWKTSLPGNICATNTNPARLHCCMLWKSMNYLKIKLNK